MFVGLSTRGIATATAVAATLEAVAAAAAAGHAQAGAPNNTDDNAEKDETADDHKCNSRPPIERLAMAFMDNLLWDAEAVQLTCNRREPCRHPSWKRLA